MSTSEVLKEELLATDVEFRKLHDEHQACERRLAELVQMSLLSQQDEIEEKQLKRHKLTLKDQMAAIVRERELEGAAITA